MIIMNIYLLQYMWINLFISSHLSSTRGAIEHVRDILSADECKLLESKVIL